MQTVPSASISVRHITQSPLTLRLRRPGSALASTARRRRHGEMASSSGKLIEDPTRWMQDTDKLGLIGPKDRSAALQRIDAAVTTAPVAYQSGTVSDVGDAARESAST